MLKFSSFPGEEVLQSETLRLYKSPDNILHGEIIGDVKITIEEAKVNSDLRASLLDEYNPVPYICNIKKLLSVNLEARRFMSQDITGLSCIALVVDSGLSKIIGDYAVWINKPKIPIKLFNRIEDAVEWVKENEF